MLSLVWGWGVWRAGSMMQASLPLPTQFEFCCFPSFDTLLTQTLQHTSACNCYCNYRKREKAVCNTFNVIVVRDDLNCMQYWIFTCKVCSGHLFLIVFLCFLIPSTRLIFPFMVTFIKKKLVTERTKSRLNGDKKLKWTENFPKSWKLNALMLLLCQVNSLPPSGQGRAELSLNLHPDSHVIELSRTFHQVMHLLCNTTKIVLM